ncbi:MAG: sulfite exporter TauE/SafE family protein [Ilumatobacteraceae bacterium]|nr:sulfite exporter TauE/SafE family protein [Ilumatobacteraceae bacterium]
MIAATIAGLWLPTALACVALTYVGAAVQATLGIGLGMLAAPVLALLDPSFVPVVVVISVLPLSIAVAVADRAHVQTAGIGMALLGRVPGVVVGAFLVARISDNLLSVGVAVVVLAGVAASITVRRFQPTSTALFGAGFASGITGTAVGIGGPPMALTYQHDDRARMRSSLSVFFGVGTILSIGALTLAGQIGRHELELTALVLPAVMLGWWTSRVLQHRVPTEAIRPIVLALCAFSAVALLVQTM